MEPSNFSPAKLLLCLLEPHDVFMRKPGFISEDEASIGDVRWENRSWKNITVFLRPYQIIRFPQHLAFYQYLAVILHLKSREEKRDGDWAPAEQCQALPDVFPLHPPKDPETC